MTDNEHPVTIRDDAQFKMLVRTWDYAGLWESFNLVYEGKLAVPHRLHGFVVIASNDPAEPYGALVQMAPSQARTDSQTNCPGRKLLAKIRLN